MRTAGCAAGVHSRACTYAAAGAGEGWGTRQITSLRWTALPGILIALTMRMCSDIILSWD